MTVEKPLLEKAIQWFANEFGRTVAAPISSHFPNYRLADISSVIARTNNLLNAIKRLPGSPMSHADVGQHLAQSDPDQRRLFKHVVLRYRRHCAAETELLTEKTFHLKLTDTVEQDIKTLDTLVREGWFEEIEMVRLPRLQDFIPVQLIEAVADNQKPLPPRQYDEKFHILQAPQLFLPDLAYFRAKCEERETPLAIAFLDIDHFKQFNTDHTETKVDRNLLPHFMQAIEAHVFHHGYAYRQGGDEYLILVPSLSRPLAVAFLDELRRKLADLEYPEIEGKTTVSVGLCVVDADCPLTDRELRDRASLAKKFAKDNGRNCIAIYEGPRFIPEELQVTEA